MALVTVFLPPTTTGSVVTGSHITGETRLVAVCRVKCEEKPIVFVVQSRTIFCPVALIWISGNNEKLNIVPKPVLPPSSAVPYNVFPDKSKAACG